MKYPAVAVAILTLTLTIAGVALGVTPSKELVFDKSPMGPVTFSGRVHANAGFQCNDCHKPDLFPKMQKGTVSIKMKSIYAGQLCGACHNGKTAFKALGNCTRCHKK